MKIKVLILNSLHAHARFLILLCQRLVAESWLLQVSDNFTYIIWLGLDASSMRAYVDWETFLKLYCIFDMGEVEKQKLIAFWSKFFDQEMKGFCKEAEYMDILEKLVRGKCMKESSEFTV